MPRPFWSQTCARLRVRQIIPEDEDDEVEKFREFLDNVTPEDFAG